MEQAFLKVTMKGEKLYVSKIRKKEQEIKLRV